MIFTRADRVDKTAELLPAVDLFVCLVMLLSALLCSLCLIAKVLLLNSKASLYFIVPLLQFNDSVQGMPCRAGASCGYSGDGMYTDSSVELPCDLCPW